MIEVGTALSYSGDELKQFITDERMRLDKEKERERAEKERERELELERASSSSRMRVIYHNWSATKQRPHPQSVAEISHHSVLSGDRIRQ